MAWVAFPGEGILQDLVEFAFDHFFGMLIDSLAMPAMEWASGKLAEASTTQVFITDDGSLAPVFHPAYARMLWFGLMALMAMSAWELVVGSMQGGVEGARRAAVRIASFVVFIGWFAPVTLLVTTAIDQAALDYVGDLEQQLSDMRTYIGDNDSDAENMPLLFISTSALAVALVVAAFQVWAHQFLLAAMLVLAPVAAAMRGEKAMVKLAIGNAAFFPALMMFISIGVESGITRNGEGEVSGVSSWPVLMAVVMSLFAFPVISRLLESMGVDGEIAQQQIHAGQQSFKMYTGPRNYVRGRRVALNQRYTAMYGRPLDPGQTDPDRYSSKMGKIVARRWNNRELSRDPVGRFAIRAARFPRNAVRVIRGKKPIERQPITGFQQDKSHYAVMEASVRDSRDQRDQLANRAQDQRDRLAQAANMLQQTLHDSGSEQSQTLHNTTEASRSAQHQQVMDRLDRPIQTTRATGQGRRRGGGGRRGGGSSNRRRRR